MKKLLFTFAGAAALAALAADPAARTIDTKSDISLVGFESYTADATVIGYNDGGTEGNSLWTATGDDASLVKTYGGDNAAVPSITVPAPFSDGGDKYLALDTNGSELQRDITTTVDAEGTYIDTLVQFTPSESAPTGSDLTGAKLAIWLGVVNNVTNLYVQGNYWDFDSAPVGTSQAYALTGKAIEPGTWYRLTVKAIPNILNQDSSMSIPAFQIFVDGTDMVLSSSPLSAVFAELLDQSSMYASADIQAAAEANKLVPSIQTEAGTYGDAVTLTSVGFKGTGALDDFVVTTIAPDLSAPAIDFTLTWASGVTPVSYTIDGGTPVSLSGETSPFAVPGLTGGESVAFTFTNADGATKTMTATVADDGDIDAGDAVWAWADYLGEAVAGAYTIDDANDLDMLRKGVAANLATLGETFKQTANIDMTSAGAFAGIGAYAANPTEGTPFAGTYDGQGFKIANITMTARNYGGVFNQVNGGTIQNLTVENISVPSDATGEYGYAIIGNAGNGAVLQNLVAAGSFLSAAKPGTHNMAGIVVRECGGSENGSLIKDCTNNATIYGDYTKLGGICALTQLKVKNGGPATFDGCVNNGALISARTSEANAASAAITGIAGIVGYTADATVLKDCVNNGTITVSLANQKVGELIGSGGVESGSLTDAGGNKADATKKMVHTRSNVTGFKYATVADNKATTVLPPLAAGNTYLLEGNVAASETPVATLTAVGDTIAFDTALGYTFAGTVAGSGAAGYPTASTSGTVTTYTAGYFPRTATAGQDGSAANPFEIADEDDLLALQAAVANDVGRNLAYVQTADIALTAAWPGIGVGAAKDLVNGSGKDIPAYEAGAFAGVYDGGNCTISNFQLANGADYGALFNSINGATIKNLKISWGAEYLTPSHSGDTGATFVGVARNSTLLNLTTLAGTVTTVSAGKDIAGIVGYLMAGSTVDSCTNEINVASLGSSRKCGGIAIISQDGSGTAVIRNCKNSGTVTATNKGGILGYVGVATEIDGCENTAALQLFHFQSGSVTASGVNKGNATVASNDKSDGVSGLYFATVDGNVATFVADNALALNGSYKVMSAGATATFAFAEAGTIAFDTALFTPTYAITAAEGLTLTDATAGTVKTYTAAAQSSGWADDPATVSNETAAVAYPDLAGTALANADAYKLTVWAGANNVDYSDVTAAPGNYVEAYMLNCAPADVAEEKAAFKAEITMGANGVPVVTYPTETTDGAPYNVTPTLKGATSLTGEWTTVSEGSTSYQFYKAVLSL